MFESLNPDSMVVPGAPDAEIAMCATRTRATHRQRFSHSSTGIARSGSLSWRGHAPRNVRFASMFYLREHNLGPFSRLS